MAGRLPLSSALLIGAVLAACGGPGGIAEVDLQIRVTAGRTTVKPGEGFPVKVTRIWRKDIEPSPWDDGMLSPLVVRAGATTRREDRLRVEETRTFRAHAFTLKDAIIPPVLMVGRSIGGTGKLLTRSEPVPLTVVPELDPGAPGEPEWPAVPEPLRPRWPLVLLAGALTAALAGFYLVRRRSRATATPTTAEVAAASPAATALAALDRLGDGPPTHDVSAFADVLRRYVGDRFDVPVLERTSPEITAATPAAHRAVLADLLGFCDLVKFAEYPASAAERDALLERARAYVRATSEGGP